MPDSMIVFARTHDLLAWLLPKSERFPRAYRHTVVKRMMDAALDVNEALCDAQSRRGTRRLEQLERADGALDRLRLYLRLAHGWHWLNDGQYEHVSRLVAEVGRLLGGWLRQAGATRRE